jgi:hypothetical protein
MGSKSGDKQSKPPLWPMVSEKMETFCEAGTKIPWKMSTLLFFLLKKILVPTKTQPNSTEKKQKNFKTKKNPKTNQIALHHAIAGLCGDHSGGRQDGGRRRVRHSSSISHRRRLRLLLLLLEEDEG